MKKMTTKNTKANRAIKLLDDKNSLLAWPTLFDENSFMVLLKESCMPERDVVVDAKGPASDSDALLYILDADSDALLNILDADSDALLNILEADSDALLNVLDNESCRFPLEDGCCSIVIF